MEVVKPSHQKTLRLSELAFFSMISSLTIQTLFFKITPEDMFFINSREREQAGKER